jgi:hypothetical protein
MAEVGRGIIYIVERLSAFASKGARAAKAAKRDIGNNPDALKHLCDAEMELTAAETCLAQLRRRGVL